MEADHAADENVGPSNIFANTLRLDSQNFNPKDKPTNKIQLPPHEISSNYDDVEASNLAAHESIQTVKPEKTAVKPGDVDEPKNEDQPIPEIFEVSVIFVNYT